MKTRSRLWMMIDLSKVFCLLSHDLFLLNFKYYLILWNLRQCFEINGNLSEKKYILKLGNLKFRPSSRVCLVDPFLCQCCSRFFINDSFYSIEHCSMYNYADDNITISCADRNLESVIYDLVSDSLLLVQ